MIQQDHLQIFDLTLNVWAPLFVGNGSSYTKKEYMYNTRNGKVSFLDEQKFFSFLVEHDLVDKYGQFMLSEQSNLWAFLTKDCGISDAELKTLTRYQIEVGDALDAEHSLKEIHAFQRDAQGHAYIPGSSIKGALRTAWLLSAVLADRSTGHSLAQNRRAAFPEEKYVNQLHLHGSIASDAVNSIFRGMKSFGRKADRLFKIAEFFRFFAGCFICVFVAYHYNVFEISEIGDDAGKLLYCVLFDNGIFQRCAVNFSAGTGFLFVYDFFEKLSFFHL